jgi:uncharacterized protein (TIGR02996 family)
MTTEQFFLAAIAADPEDRQARLIYADWLEDQGDARAELIRIMEEMHTLAPYSDRFWELRWRRALLKRGASGDWLTALGYNVYRPLFTQMPAERAHRWRLITEFIETWHGPLGDSPRNTDEEIVATEERLGFKLPAALREWYRLFGKRGRPTIISRGSVCLCRTLFSCSIAESPGISRNRLAARQRPA